MMDTVEALTINYEEEGILKVKELDKVLLSKGGAWVTMMYRYKEWQAKTEDYGVDKYVIRRYQKKNGEYKSQSKFVVTNAEQARKIIESLSEWINIIEE